MKSGDLARFLPYQIIVSAVFYSVFFLFFLSTYICFVQHFMKLKSELKIYNVLLIIDCFNSRQRTVSSKSSSSDYFSNCGVIYQLCLTVKDITQYSRLRHTASLSVNQALVSFLLTTHSHGCCGRRGNYW